ncbi:MAG: hypothetical protein ACRDG3_13745 [Tepidiformaceae bacterium]
MAVERRRAAAAYSLFVLALGTIAVAGAAACSSSSAPPPPSVTPSGVGSGAHVGGWITKSYTVDQAHKEVDQYFGQTTQLPRDVPPGLVLKAIWLMPPPSPGVLQIERLDYYPKDFVPPTAVGQAIPPNEPHIQVEAFNHKGSEGGQTTPLDLGLAGYTVLARAPSPTAQDATPGDAGGAYHISGHGLSWEVVVWPSSPPSQADLMKFLRGIPPQ